MKIKYQLLDSREFSVKYASRRDFLRRQSVAVPEIPDSARVVMMELEGSNYPFEGTIAELFYELSK